MSWEVLPLKRDTCYPLPGTKHSGRSAVHSESGPYQRYRAKRVRLQLYPNALNAYMRAAGTGTEQPGHLSGELLESGAFP